MNSYLFIVIFYLNGLCIFGQKPPLNYYILEELPQFTLIGNIPIDAKLDIKYTHDVLRKLKFNFLGQAGTNQDLFMIKEGTGIIRTGKKIDRDTLCPEQESCCIDLDVVVQPVEYFEIIKLKINILDINDHKPQFPTETLDFQISESSMPGASFSIPSATDPDSAKYSIKKYTLSSTSGVFDLKVTTGPDNEADLRLVLRQSLDRELIDFYQMQVIALDGDTPSKSGNLTVNIYIKDANDNNPIFSNNSYEVDVNENAPFGTTFLHVTATDPDDGTNGEIDYLFAKHTINLYGHIFGINGRTGGLYLKGDLDYETAKVYTLSLRAYDKGQDSTPAQATVLVRVKDVNDNAPQISVNTLTNSGEAEVTENSEKGTFVAHISILDPDSGDNGLVTCTLNDTRFNLKKLFKTEYKIITTEVFDREKQSSYVIALRCSDMGIPAQVITQIMMVNILDENDNPPKFTQEIFQGSLLENSPVGTPVLVINASDPDDEDNARLSYQLHSDAANKFLINSYTGSVVSHTKFDYEMQKEVRFQVLVRDNGKVSYTSTAEVIVKIKDTDDEKPEFLKDNYFFRTVENQPVGTILGKVTVNDADSKPYSQFYISWQDKSDDIAREHFNVDPLSGTVSLKKILDRETKGLYQFGLKAVSKTNLNFADTTFVTIYVEDQNDNRPIIAFPNGNNNSIYVWTETQIHTVVGRIRASDQDKGVNSKLIYNITRGDNDHIFVIDQETGALTLSKPIPHNIGPQINLKIAVHDKGRPSLASSSRLTVKFTSEPAVNALDLYSSSRAKKGPVFDQITLVIVATLGGLAGLLCIVVVAAIFFLKKRKNTNKEKCVSVRETQQMLNHGQVGEDQRTYTSVKQRSCHGVGSSCILCSRHRTLIEDSFSSASSAGSQILEGHYMVMNEQGCCHHPTLQCHHSSMTSTRRQRLLPDPPYRGATSPSPSSTSSIHNHTSESDIYGRVIIHKNQLQPENRMFVPIPNEYSTPVDSRNSLDNRVMVGVKFLGQSQGRDKVCQRLNPARDSVAESVSDSGISDACVDISPQSSSSGDPDYASIPYKIRRTQNTQRIEEALPV